MQPRMIETPRPRPPAKIRRSLAKASTTPPPAYAQTFAFPSVSDEVNGAEWGAGNIIGDRTDLENLNDDLAWSNGNSGDELTDLLAKADTLIKKRENGLNLTSAARKSLYENNVALKTKHEALLHSMSLSPTPNANPTSSFDQSPTLPQSPLRPMFNRSTSEFAVSSPKHLLSKSHNYNPRRGVSSPALDISFLVDQNAELLSKLEKLESEATSADIAGRREFRRLEKDITMLKEELEKTQARSDELEEKAKKGFGLGAGKVLEDAWKKREEREARILAIKKLKPRGESGEGSTVRNFAPETPSMFRGAAAQQYPGPDLSTLEEVSISGESALDIHEEKAPTHDQELIAKLLQKIQELETTNTKILEHQTEAASRLQAVQRETEFMTQVYERLSQLDCQYEHDETEAGDQLLDGPIHGFARSRALQSQLLAAKVKRQRSFHKRETQSRGSIKGLFDEHAPDTSTPQKHKGSLPVPFSEGTWNRPRYHSTFAVDIGGLSSPALSSLSLYSPPEQLREDLMPDVTGPSLANELADLWINKNNTNRLRQRSLSDLSELSASPSPYAAPFESPVMAHRREEAGTDFSLTPSGPTNSLQLSIEPPTPQKSPLVTPQQESLLIGNMSPRFQAVRSLRARNYPFTDGRQSELLRSPYKMPNRKKFTTDNTSPTPTRGPSGGPFFIEVFQAMSDGPGARNATPQSENVNTNISRSPSPDPEDYTDAKEELDEDDKEVITAGPAINLNVGPDTLDDAEPYSEENSSRYHSSKASKASAFGRIMLELWMWLQFMIIMLVFLWAMARKGPKSVLRDVERKRTLSMKRS